MRRPRRPASRRIDRSRHGLPPLIQALEVRQLLTVPTVDYGPYSNGSETQTGPADTAAFHFWIVNGEGPVTIYYTISGTATEGLDYQSIARSVTIPGGSSDAYVEITPIDDALDEDDETVVLSIEHRPNDYLVQPSAPSFSVTIHDNDTSEPQPAEVRIEATDPKAAEPNNTTQANPDKGRFTITRTGDTSSSLTVEYTVSGTATAGTDYTTLAGTVTIPVGQTSVTIDVTPKHDTLKELDETVKVTLKPRPSYGYTVVGNPATVTIADNDSNRGRPTTDNNRDRDNGPMGPMSPYDQPPLNIGAPPCPTPGINPQTGQMDYSPSGNGQPFCEAPRPDYSNHTNPHPIVSVEWTLPDSGPVPDKIVATLNFGGIVGTPIHYSTAGLVPGQTVLFVMQVNASALPTGHYDYAIDLEASFGSELSTYTITGAREIFNRIDSPYGNRWWIGDLDRIVPAAGGVALIRGDATAGWFADDGAGGYITPEGSSSRLAHAGAGGWVLTHKDGGRSEFNASGLLTARVDRNGNATTYAYVDGDGDGVAGELGQATDPYGRVATYTYSGGLLQAMRDYAGRVTTYGYIGRRLTSITQVDPDGAGPLTSSVSTFAYDDNGLMTASHDATGRVTTFTYDPSSLRVLSMARSGLDAQQVTPIAIRGLVDPTTGVGTAANPAPMALPSAAKATVVDATHRTTTLTTDRFGYVTEEVDPLGNVTQYERDAHGRVLKITGPDPDGPGGPLTAPVTTFAYDGRGNLTGMTLPDLSTRVWTYDPTFSQPLSYRDETGRTTTYTLDGRGNRLTETDPLGRVTTSSYDSRGNLTSVTRPDPDGAGPLLAPTTGFTYDSKGRLTTITLPGGATQKFAYNAADDLIRETDELGRITYYQYDAMGRQTGTTQSDPDGAGTADPAVYRPSTGQWLITAPSGAPASPIAYGGSNDLPAVADYNGDGKPDLAVYRPSTGQWFFAGQAQPITYGGSNDLPAAADYNGDGIADLAVYRPSTGQWFFAGQAQPVSFGGPNDLPAPADYNGDGTADLAVYRPSTGQWFIAGQAQPISFGGSQDRPAPADYNGDGTADFATYRPSTGQWFIAGQAQPISLGGPNGLPAAADYDGDGKADLAVYRPSTGQWFIAPFSGVPTSFGIPNDLPAPADYDGDGKTDLAVYRPSTGQWFIAGQGQPISFGGPNDLPAPADFDGDGKVDLAVYQPSTGQWFIAGQAQPVSFGGPNGLPAAADYDGDGKADLAVYQPSTGQWFIAGQAQPISYGGSQDRPAAADYNGDGTADLATYRPSTGQLFLAGQGQPISLGEPNDLPAPGNYYGFGQAAPRSFATYDAAGRLTTETDPLGRVTTYQYDPAGRLASVTAPDPDGAGPLTAPVTRYAYDAEDRLTSLTDPLGRVTTSNYDPAGRLASVVGPDPDGAGPLTAPVTSYGYDNLGRLTSTTDPLGRITSFAYDVRDRLTTITAPDPDGAGPLASPVTVYSYDAVGRPTTVTDPLNRVTTSEYDAAGQLIKVTAPDPDGAGPLTAPVSIFTYDNLGRLATTLDPLGRTSTFAYDLRDRLTTITAPDPDGVGPLTAPVTRYAYDAVGNRIAVTDPLNKTTTFAYDRLDRLVTVTDPHSGLTRYAYDAVSNLTAVTDTLGKTTTSTYDGLDRLVTVADPRSGLTRYAYDAVSNRTAVTDPLGNRTTFSYDALDRLTAILDPRGLATTLAYDAADQLTGVTDRLGRRTAFAYDGLGRRTNERWLDGAGNTLRTFTSTYDAASQLLGIADPDATLTFTYDNLGRQTTATTSGAATGQPGLTLTSGYDAVGNRTRLADNLAGTGWAGPGVTTFAYDALDRLTTIARSLGSHIGPQVGFSYDADSRLTALARTLGGTGTAVNSSFAYDALDRLTTLIHQVAGGATLASYTYGYDAASRLTTETNAEGAFNYTYDDTGQLTGVGGARSEGYSYDLNGNRTLPGYVTGTGNRLEQAPGSTLIYDAEGNLTARTETASGAVTTYAYDHRNRLTAVTRKNAGGVVVMQATYTYDAFDRRIGIVVDADGAGAAAPVQSWTAYDGVNPYADFDAAGTLKTRYLHGPAVDMLLARTDAAGTTAWYLTDRLGTVHDLANTAGTVIDHVAYDSFGRVTAETNPSAGDRFKFTGRELDTATGLQYHRARYYDAALGRWTQEDPIGFAAGDANLYRYVGNGPTNATDPLGLAAGAPSQSTPPGGWASPTGAFVGGFGWSLLDNTLGWIVDLDGLAAAGSNINSDFAGHQANGRVTAGYGMSPFEALEAANAPSMGGVHQRGGSFVSKDTGGSLLAAAEAGSAALGVVSGPGIGKAAKLGKIGGKVDDLCPTPKRYRDKIDELVSGSKPSQRDLGNLPTKPTAATKQISPNQMNKAIQNGQAPKSIERVDIGKIKGEQTHVHLDDGSALNIDGSWKHGGRQLSNAEKDWLKGNGWINIPK
ncbi:RHS repeat-associated core domain-containing protein [Singulisphaera sp. GP187]|uniref:FG-GAP-like repeat-containing protein n=1 Tax=Singulisphaera sp. GP187 TaxID=1882752 RepID=UPI0009263EED|nr:FG-GAP-like repeat-containing protein [Singulisphaera sp. GP187]SIO13416.1 RHS repeat-associated core domain-containing protein [Singulisphaera sp. GP187]